MKTLVSIQYLRAVAALSVALFHAFQWTWNDFEIASAGVDLFFIISGFIMWTVTAGRPIRPLAFLRRRAARIVPLYWLVTLLLTAGALLVPARFPDVRPEAGHVLLSLAFIPHMDPTGKPFPLLAPGWTLNYEAFFYVVFAAGLFLAEGRRIAFLTFTLIFMTAFGLMHPPAYLMIANPIMLEFLAGVWIGRCWREGVLPSRSTGIGLVVCGFGLFAAFHLLGMEWDLWRPFAWGGPAVMIVLGAVAIEKAGGLPDWRWLRELGDASYSIYLWHPLAIGALAILTRQGDPRLFVPMAVPLAALVGWLSWRFIERPMLSALRRGPEPAASPAPS